MPYILTLDTEAGPRYATGPATHAHGIALTNREESARTFDTFTHALQTLARLGSHAHTEDHRATANQLEVIAVNDR